MTPRLYIKFHTKKQNELADDNKMISNVCKARSACRSFIILLLILMLIEVRAIGNTTTTFDTQIKSSLLLPTISQLSPAQDTSAEEWLSSSSSAPSLYDTFPSTHFTASSALPATISPAIFAASNHQQHYQSAPLLPLPPFKFKHEVYNVSIRENSVGKTYAAQPTNEPRMGIATTPDLDVKYRIIGGDVNKLFKAEERTVGDFTFLAIRTRTGNVILNREKVDVYHLKVRATGTRRNYKAKVVQEDECEVIVHVLDTNDLSPLFYPNEYAITVPEDTALHQNIVKVMAEDADLGINGEIYYSFLEETDWFSVHPTSGVITLIRPLKYIEKSFHELIVIATDRGSSQTNRLSQPSKAKVKIRVKQVNLHVPEIYVQALPDILENSNANIYGIVRVEDKDVGIHGKIKSLEIVDGDPNGHFRIRPTANPGEFNIEVHRLLDREKTPNGYNLTLRAVDRGTPPQQSYKVVSVRLADVNDNAPVFNREIYEVVVPETSPPNTPVIRLKVTDRDEGKNALVSLEIVGGNEGGEFRINAETGMLYTAVPLDAEAKAFYTLTVSAIDQGNTGTRKQSSAKIKINVQDTNDNDPIFEQTNVTIWVDENEPAGTTVTKVSARDRDSGENAYISYSLCNLNGVPFDIDHFSGIVRTSKLIDYESMRREYLLKVRASDWGLPYRRQTEMQLTIKIRDVNDNRPQFERTDCVGSVHRYSPIGTEVLTLSAIDFDADNYISYRIVSGNEDGCFNIDSTSGVISIGCDLNDIRTEIRNLNVTATDGTHFADVMRIEIHLLSTTKNVALAEIISSNNNNIGSGAISRYSSNSDKSASSFQCKETGVARRHAEMLAAAESNNMIGSGVDTSTNEDLPMMPIRYGQNVHAPEFIDFPNEIFINETVQLGTTVTWVKARDRDLGYNGKIVFGITSGDNDSVFRLDPDNGELKIIGYLDRERTDEYVLNITIYDLGNPQKSASKVLPVTILDENDNAPIFEKSLASFRVTENALNGTIIFRLNATDADLGENARITYSLLTDTSDFRVDPDTGVLIISSPLDRERQDLYELQIRASDNGLNRDQPRLFSDAVVRIIVEDINDNAPQFSLKEYNVRVREDIPIHAVVAITTASDLDSGPGGEVLYFLSDDIDQSFKIDKHSGTIRTTKQLDFEERQIHSLTVRAVDRGTPAISSETSVIIEIIDVNENRFAPQFDDFVLSGSVEENQPPGTHVMTVEAKDFDAPGPDSRVSYSIRGGDGIGIFTIDNDGAIRTTCILDMETKPHYWLTVCAQDQAVVPLYSCVEVFIQVENINDNAPLTEHPVYYPSVVESSTAGVKVLQLIAEDGDNDPLQKITYRITSGNPEGFFAINSSSGLITTTARKLDRENQSEHILEVMVTDNGIPQLSSTTRIVITVEDINDHSPEFDQKFYKVQIPVNAKLDQALFQVLAIDRDTGENGRITYSIRSGKGKAKFRIDSDTGVVFAAKSFEPNTEYDIHVRAEDNGLPKKSQATLVSVIVVDVPPKESTNAPPQIKTNDQHVEVTENDNPGFLVTLIQAYDDDNDQLWFDIIDGDENNDFFIGRDNGNILLSKNLDWERKRAYNLTIAVSDGIHVIQTQLYISVIDINDHRPEFSENIYRVDISESTAEGTEILQLYATDLDEDKTLFFSLHAARNPVSLKLFRIDSVTGSVTLAQELDRELMAEHILIVIVKDHGTPAKRNYAKIIVNVIDHNDHAPEFTSKIIQGKVYETAAIGSNVVTVYATDRDTGDNARIVYSIVSGNIGNVFAIDSAMGTISVLKELGANTMSEYMLQVKASDCGQPSFFAQIPVQVIVVQVDNAPPKFSRTETAVEIYENLPIGTFVMHIEARSTSSVQFDIIDGNVDDMFFINPSTGVITTKDSLDYERTKFYNLTVRATNMASASATGTAIIHVLDRNDNAPYFMQQLYKGEISESVPIASLILAVNDTLKMDQSVPLVIKAYDIDAGLNSHLHYDIVETMPRRYFHIDSTTGAIKTVMLLDHEKIPLFTFHVKVTDLGKPRLSSETVAQVQISVTDVNDCPPVFTQSEYNVTLLLPTYENVAVLQVNATDRDESNDEAQGNSTLRYEFAEDSNKDGVFAINSHTGVITTRNVEGIDAFYKLHVRVSDGKYTSSAVVNINVETSENSGLVFQKSVYEGSILENSTKITTVTVVNVIGSALNEHIEFRLLNPTEMFSIGLTSGAVITTGKRFDREQQPNHELIVEARSYAPYREKPRVAHVIVNVTILDINDNCPMFVNLPYYAIVSVDAERGSMITKVHALDADSYENGEVRYEMKRGHGELFKVDRKTGEVTLKQTLEGHNRDFDLLIAAYDGGITPCSTDVTVHVKVIDKSMPVFSKQFYSDIVPENIELHTPLSVAIQAESPLGRKLIYTIVKGNELEEFTVDFNTGAIYVVDELDYERRQHYELVIRATDSVSGVSAEVPVSVLIQDVNDCLPEFEMDNYNVTVSEGASFGTAILKVTAHDNDTGVNQLVTYAIQTDNKNTSEYFQMDPLEGVVYLKKPLDHEQLAAHHFTVIATDKGIPSLSSTAHVWIRVMDMNDNPPKFEQSSYSCSLSQHAVRGQFVTVVSASDPDYIDADNLMYAIAEGNELQTYSIDPISGIITLVNMQNFAENHSTILNVSVTDSVYTSFIRVQINILPANLHNPVFSHLVHEVKINENQMAGRLVITINAIDEDFGEYGMLTYDIFSDEMKEYFSIDKTKGEIVTKIRLNREEQKIYELPIIATDGGGRSGFTTVKIKVGDVNDNAPEFYLREYKTSIYGNLSINATFLNIKAFDADENQNSVIKYAIYDTQNAGVKELFGIDEDTGAMFLVKKADRMENQMFQFFVRAHDGGSPSLHTDIPVDIYIMAQTDVPPQFEKKERILFLLENSPPGTVITRLKLTTTNATAKYRIASESNMESPQFTIMEDGELRLAKALDRETKDLHYIGIYAESDSSPSLTAFCEILLHVQDENDNSPVFDSSRYNLVLAENIEKGSTIMKVTAHDADIGSNGDVRYSFDSEAGEMFNIFDVDAHTGAITTLVSLDREQVDEYHFRVLATDNGQPRRSAQTNVFIKLKDYNDCPPLFKNSNYSASVVEDALPGTVVLQLSTTDRDIGLDTAVEYYILSGDSQSQFQIRNTGELYVAKELDRETIPNYTLDIIVTDGTFTTHTNVTIDVLDANDNPPYCLKYRYKQTLSEGIHPASFVLSVLATDADEGENAKLRFYLTGDGDDDFTLDESSGHLKTARQLDRERQSRYHLIAHVQDHDRSGWECSSQIEIIVSDLNDNAPVFSMPIYTVSLPEDAEVGILVTKMHATDNDIGVNRKINYSFIDSCRDHFKIVPDSGIITLAKALDREEKDLYNLTVQAFDQGIPKMFSTAFLIVNVQDINDNPPEFTSKYYTASIIEETPIGSEVIRVLATSKDTGINAMVKYSFIGGNEQHKFEINNETGVIYVSDNLDYERAKDYFLTIQAVDLGEPPLSNLATLNISVIDSNDNRPQFTQTSYNARIREDSMIADKILQVIANDVDAGENGRVSYTIVRGDRLQQFAIERNTGYVSVAGTLDRESISSYVLEIEALDHGVPPLSSYVLLNVEISDANDNAPLFSQTNYTTFVQEDKPIGHVLLKFVVTDADAPPNGEPYTFDIISGNEAAFRIEQDGVLRTASRFNHKVKDSYLLQVRVFDNGTPLLHSDAWVKVKVIEESQYPPVIIPQEISVNAFGDVFQGGPVGNIFASDQDKYDTLVYDLAQTSGVLYTPKSLFNISRTNGTLYALPKLDVGDYRVNVTVSDGKFTVFAIIKVSVDLITDEMLDNAVIIRFSEVTPEQFILSHRKTFIRSIRNAIGSRLKDVIIISVQPSSEDSNIIRHRYNRDTHNISLLLDDDDVHKHNKRQLHHDLDVLFTVRKHQLNPNVDAFYSSDAIRTLLSGKLNEIEKLTELSVEEVVKPKCLQRTCSEHGKCVDKMQLDTTQVNTVSTDVTGFVAARFEHMTRCRCEVGYGGEKCENSINECANNPCPSYKTCVPDLSPQGYYCICPKGFGGPTCDKDIIKCADDSCYVPKNPVTFAGKSYIQYKMEKAAAKKALEEKCAFSLRIRTVQPTGTLMFAAGKVDYNILEIVNGVIQYRFDLGSGEGLISVTSIYVSDGQWHDIRLEREGNSGRLVVNGKHVAQGNAPGVNGVLNLQTNDMYLGAEVKPHPSVLGFEDVQRGFVGCIDDVNLSRIPLTIHNAGTSNSIAILKRAANIEFNCDTAAILQPLGVCGSQPCLNGGTCKDTGNDNFECVCHSRFNGKLCGIDTDPCASAPCLFGGKCRAELQGNYTCECPARMTGKRCDFGRFCSPNPCRNGGVCEEGDNGPICMCRGYMGVTCEIDVDECEKQPCGAGATCINEAGSFRCICPPDLTGASCGDPLYSNSITSKLKNIPMEQIIGIISGISVIFFVLVVFLSFRLCKRRAPRSHTNNINNDTRKENAMLVSVTRDTSEYKRNSKMSNLEVSQRNEQRPASFTASGNEPTPPYACNNVFVNNLDTLRSYGSAGDELENVPPEYRKPTRINHNQHVNLNGHAGAEADSKQTWSDYLQLQSFTDNKINNDLKRTSPISSNGSEHRCATLKSSGVLPGRLLNVPLPNPNMQYQGAATPTSSSMPASNLDDSTGGNHGEAYHWDCSDWVRRSHNPLPNITEVPGSEVPDSSSFHSNESNESQCKKSYQSQRTTADPSQDAAAVTEDEIETEFNDSECERRSIAFTNNSSIPTSLNPLDSGSDDYRFASAESYLKHPNSYLPKYNVQSETDGETQPLNSKIKNSMDGHESCESDLDDEEDDDDVDEDSDDDEPAIQSYGFPQTHNRREIDFIINSADESSSLLRQHRKAAKQSGSKSNFKDELNTSSATTASSASGSSSGGKTVKWANNIQTTQV